MKKNIILFITITITILLLFVGCSNGNNSQNDDNSPETNEVNDQDIDEITFATSKLIGTWIVTNEEIYTGTDVTSIPNITFNSNGQGEFWKEGEERVPIKWSVKDYYYEWEKKSGYKNHISVQFIPEPEIHNIIFSFNSDYTNITINGLFNNDTYDFSFIYSKQ